MMRLYAQKQGESISHSAIVRKGIELLCVDIPEEEIEAELVREEEELRASIAASEE